MLDDEGKKYVGSSHGSTRSKKKKSANILMIISDYKPEPGVSKGQRLAHFLHWFSIKAPYVYVPSNFCVRAIMGYPYTPKVDAPDVISLQGCVSRAREIMLDKHRRGLHSLRGLGLRATIDDQDTANTQLRGNVKRLVGAHNATKRTASIVDASKVRDDRIRAWVRGGVVNALKALDADGRLDRLLPPAPEFKK